MDKICIRGGAPLTGVIPIGGAKNAALPLMAASLLTAETVTLENVPALADIATIANLLVQHGVAVQRGGDGAAAGHILELSAAHITSSTAPYDLVRKMRASVLVLGPLVAAARGCHCRAVAQSGPVQSTSTSRACNGWALKSNCAKAISTRAHPRGCVAPR